MGGAVLAVWERVWEAPRGGKRKEVSCASLSVEDLDGRGGLELCLAKDRVADPCDTLTERTVADLRCALRMRGHVVPPGTLKSFRAEVGGAVCSATLKC